MRDQICRYIVIRFDKWDSRGKGDTSSRGREDSAGILLNYVVRAEARSTSQKESVSISKTALTSRGYEAIPLYHSFCDTVANELYPIKLGERFRF